MKSMKPKTITYADPDSARQHEKVKSIRKQIDDFRKESAIKKVTEEEYQMKDCIQLIYNEEAVIQKPVKYRSDHYPYALFNAKFDLALHNLFNKLTAEKVVLEYLKKQGMTLEEINKMVKTGVYMKDHPEEKKSKEDKKPT